MNPSFLHSEQHQEQQPHQDDHRSLLDRGLDHIQRPSFQNNNDVNNVDQRRQDLIIISPPSIQRHLVVPTVGSKEKVDRMMKPSSTAAERLTSTSSSTIPEKRSDHQSDDHPQQRSNLSILLEQPQGQHPQEVEEDSKKSSLNDTTDQFDTLLSSSPSYEPSTWTNPTIRSPLLGSKPPVERHSHVRRHHNDYHLNHQNKRDGPTNNQASNSSPPRSICHNVNQPMSSMSYPPPQGHNVSQNLPEDHLVSSNITHRIRKSRRAEFRLAIAAELTDIVTDMYLAEWTCMTNNNQQKVATRTTSTGTIPPAAPPLPPSRSDVASTVQEFIMSLPQRYANGVIDTPSHVLLHMRLMSAVRSNPLRPTVHITDMLDFDNDDDDENEPYDNSDKQQNEAAKNDSKTKKQLVTICCTDKHGLLEYIAGILATGGSRVLDADVMLSKDNIALDRFVVDMAGRLRLDKLEHHLSAFLRKESTGPRPADKAVEGIPSPSSPPMEQNLSAISKEPLYFRPENIAFKEPATSKTILAAKPILVIPDEPFLPLKRSLTLPVSSCMDSKFMIQKFSPRRNTDRVPAKDGIGTTSVCGTQTVKNDNTVSTKASSMREKRPLINRPGQSILTDDLEEPPNVVDAPLAFKAEQTKTRAPQRIPFEQLALIETLGTGRVSTIYKAVWTIDTAKRPTGVRQDQIVVALKVAMVDPETQDTSNVDELRREADIASRLDHPNICRLVGYAEDSDCFCLAYQFCERGSLMSVMADMTMTKTEFLPIALDICYGMAYLHARGIIHRDLKLTNVLITADGRAKVSDFGMSAVLVDGRELTAETGTYRYMSPEVLRHSPYSTNADVYSFGISLWQLMTKEIPFAGMTPIQAAFQVAQGVRPALKESIPKSVRKIISSCWQQDAQKRPSFTYLTMELCSLVDQVDISCQRTRAIANHMIANVDGNSNINVDMSAPLVMGVAAFPIDHSHENDADSAIGLQI